MRLLHIDAFTDRPFSGNPAGVVLLDRPRDDGWRQAVAAEMNLAETAFVDLTAVKVADGEVADGAVAGGEVADGAADDPPTYPLRWFTPTVEVDLCGHATLASAHALWETGVAADRLLFTTRSGILTAERTDGRITLDLPIDRPYDVTDSERQPVLAALGVAEAVRVRRGRDKFLVEVADENAVRAVRPAFDRLQALPMMGAVVTARADGATAGSADFVSRFFAPAIGIDEDPVTGAAHCLLAPYWAAELGRDALTGYQASARGGFVGVRCTTGPNDEDRVLLSGHAVTVIRGEID